MTTKAWIATAIVAPLSVGLILLTVEYSYFRKKPTPESSLSVQAKDIAKSIETTRKEDSPNSEPDVSDLEALYTVASKIYGSTERNAEYEKIITCALAENKLGFSFTVAKQIYGSTERNKQYTKIIDGCIRLKRFSLAVKVADEIYGSPERNEQYTKIKNAEMKERTGATSNEIMQPPAKGGG